MNYINEEESINKYFKDIKKHKVLTIDEENDLLLRIKNGDEKSIDKLIKCNLKFVISIAKEYQGLGLSLADLISEGNLGLVKSIPKFDSSRGFRFISYAVWWIRQSIMQSLNDNSRMIRLPSNVINELYKANKELGDYETLDKNYPTCVSLNSKISKNDGDENMELENMISDSDVIHDVLMDFEENNLSKVLNNTLNKLDDREKDIIKCYFGLNRNYESMTLEAIGDKYNLTKERVRQIKEKALRTLRHENNELYDLLNK